ncbi:ATP-binding cassette domain-containing protein [Candidatus Bathyarchaeota archaeon]|nr:ATP-binding cassette domain-containing protein [Candidatus Bathyarchaeota archaeon]
MTMSVPTPLEFVLYSGDEFKEAIDWANERSDEQILVNVQGSEAFDLGSVVKTLPKVLIRAGFDLSKQLLKQISGKRVEPFDKDVSKLKMFKDIEIQGFLLKAKKSLRNKYIALSVYKGHIGDIAVPRGSVITLGSRRTRNHDVRTNVIQMENQFKKNYEQRQFFHGKNLSGALNYLNKLIETTQVNAQVWGIWAKSKQVFFGRGRVLRVVQKSFPKRRYFVMMLDEGTVGQGNELEKGRIIRIGGNGFLNVEQVVAKKILFDPRFGVEVRNYENVLDVENLTVHYGNPSKVDPVIENVNFAIKDGEILGIVGESGAGKTTTVKAIIGDLARYQGQIKLCGINAQKKQKVSPMYGYVPQDLSKMYLTYTPLRNIIHFGSQYGIPEEELIRKGKEILKDLGIFSKANQPVDSLSGGEKRRTSIAIALVHKPRILFLDEPTSGLDPTTRHELWSYLDKISRQYGISLVVITHYPEEGEYCDKVAIFMKGKGFLEFGTPKNLKSRLPGGGFAAELTLEEFDPEAIDLLRKIEEIDLILQRGGSIRIFSKNLDVSLYDNIVKVLNDNGHSIHRIEPKAEIDMIDYFLYKVKTYRAD